LCHAVELVSGVERILKLMHITYEKFQPGAESSGVGGSGAGAAPYSFIAAGDGHLSVVIRVVSGRYSLTALQGAEEADALNSVLVQRCSGDTFSFHSFYCKFRDGMRPFHRGVERPAIMIDERPPMAGAMPPPHSRAVAVI
jgi:hypothetical protein